MKRTLLRLALLLLAAPTVRSQESAASLFNQVNDLIGDMTGYQVDPVAAASLLRAPTPEEWQSFWSLINHALQGESVEELAWMKPYAESALLYLDQVPEAKPYADWLRQRMDFFEAADEAVQAVKPPPARPAPTAPPSRPKSVLPPTAPPVAPPKQDRDHAAAAVAVEQDRWMRKLEGRPPPARAADYVPRLKPIFEREGVPGELVWLAEVESTFNPKARSPVGAMGLYQFMPATAERFGLALRPEDERLIPERSAYAAARYLKFLHGRFGDWSLALAAYNAGEGRVGKLLKRHKGTRFEDIAPHLPSETRMYVPKMRAVVSVREGTDLTRL